MKKGIGIKVSLLLAASVAGTAAAINGNIPAIDNAFPGIPLSMIELLATIPSLFLIISTLLANSVAKNIGYKKTALIGLGINAVCGIIPAVISDFHLIFISRALFGFGIGLFYPMVIAITSSLYEKEERAKLIGLLGGFQGVGGIIVTSLSGQLLLMGWQTSFWSYAIIFPIFFLFLSFVPNTLIYKHREKDIQPIKETEVQEEESVSKSSFLLIFTYTLFLFIVANLFMTVGIKTGTLMIASGYGTHSDGSTLIAMLCIGSIIGGVAFNGLLKQFGRLTLMLGVMVLALAMFITGIAHNLPVAAFGAMLAGFSTKVILPYLINNVNDGRVKNNVMATSILLAGYNLGLTVSPYTSLVVEKSLATNSLHDVFIINGIFLIVLVIVLLVYTMAKRNTKNINYMMK